MASTTINLGRVTRDTAGIEKPVLIATPDMRIVKVSFLGPLLMLVAGVLVYLLPLGVDRDFQLVGSFLIAGTGLVGIICLLALSEALSKAVYRLTDEHIEEEYGIVYKRLRRIPLSYVRDVTHSQNFLQAIFGVSSITVSPTNGDKIVLSNVKDGNETREVIWKFALSRSPTGR